MRTCWRRMNSFTSVAQTIYAQYVHARMVNYAWLFQEFRKQYDQLGEDNTSSEIKHNITLVQQQLSAKLDHLKEVQETTINDPEHAIFHHTLFNQPNMLRSDHAEERLLAKINHMSKHTINNQDLIFVKQPSDHCRYLKVIVEQHTVACLHYNSSLAINNTEDDNDDNQVFNIHAVKRAQQNKSKATTNEHDHQMDLASQTGACETLCCGRGFRQKIIYKTKLCDCKFEFCCRVRCRRKCKTSVVQYECL